jgi:hypothetical protein
MHPQRDLVLEDLTLDPTPEDLAQARQVFLKALVSEYDSRKRRERFFGREDFTDARKSLDLAHAVARLKPTVADLTGAGTWPRPLPEPLLAAARQNSELPAWLAALKLFQERSSEIADQ